MESAQAVLTGQAPVVPGVDDASVAPTDDMDVDADTEMNMPPRDDEDDEDDIDDPAAALGRERR